MASVSNTRWALNRVMDIGLGPIPELSVLGVSPLRLLEIGCGIGRNIPFRSPKGEAYG